MSASPDEIVRAVESLVGAWCDRRALGALRAILAGWPLTGGLTDDWGQLVDALEKVRTFARGEVTDQEMERIEDVIRSVHEVIDRRLRG